MHLRYGSLITVFALLLPSVADAQLALSLIDRKFPSGQFCPVETRDGSLVSFDAPLNGAVRITFTADNQFPNFEDVLAFNNPRIDNVMVMTLDQWNTNQGSCSSDCFAFDFNFGSSGTSSYPSDAGSLAQIAYSELFDADPHGGGQWEGGSWESGPTALDDDATGTDCSTVSPNGGSLALGDANLGDVRVSASVVVGGLTPGETYVAFCWFYIDVTNDDNSTQLEIRVEETNVVSTESRSFGTLKASWR